MRNDIIPADRGKLKIDSRERSYTLMHVRASQEARPSLVPLITNWLSLPRRRSFLNECPSEDREKGRKELQCQEYRPKSERVRSM